MKEKQSNLCVLQSEYIDSQYYTVNFDSKKTTLINLFSYYLRPRNALGTLSLIF